jgi:hypothetical protein
VTVKRLDAGQQLLVVAEGYEDLRVVAHGLLEHGERALADLVLLERAQLALVELRFGDVHVLAAYASAMREKSDVYKGTSW